MKNPLFRFKQFQIDQSKSAMKIGTDGVLLGAWTSVNCKPKTILDIGSGTGLIALMLAQRTASSIIKAIEIEEDAAAEAAANFKDSPWSDRLELIHADILNYTQKSIETFDLIVSNPPFLPLLLRHQKTQEVPLEIITTFPTKICFLVLINY